MRIREILRPTAGVLLTAVLLFVTGFRTTAVEDRGKEVFDTICSSCHSLAPPPTKAPPMIMIAGHYVDARTTEDAAMEAMRAWLAGPSADKSLLPAHAVERFGLMPPLVLPEDDRDAVVAYVFAQRSKAGSPEPRMETDSTPSDSMRCSGGKCGMHGPEGTGTGMGMQCPGMREGMQGMDSSQPSDSTSMKRMHRMHRRGQGN